MIGTLPNFRNVWEPRVDGGDATFYFVEMLGVMPKLCGECGEWRDSKRAFHVVVVSADGDYVSPPLNI